ncbi:hypothetical protein CcaverHIS002_0403080 [Cutaneotrichosporon cavernicola]|uniref:Uncharacterized protein n=1 Tax=Cutaneotrichosporon cavernicola TaxID=279322 RepID=A0AA48QVL8_9TREE|nr:uncharacterized protein CcaverHIS019_0403040 [Cutaneotrichosporon cavernicola]BEI83704.1 hypothetical protein CcaverHIS002_0403080 [Cutaneotrichosporon cavernicola]BEI91484.1 hypothetical protein CcaverHIS019_0403040 [Cutaneotrichosporon cavernicola]BEI99259.1 hypothetical protein CcaverHIS631_0403020 [Cutaneotrichosporon cavernicola]BEJ07036.1 hypothetical protein CcaverHIS641_0403050 [Cutaneotrichosporon cavernicola]
MEKLPLKVRVAIRDLWEPTTSPAFRRLMDVLGTEPTIDPEWAMLHAALGGVFNDDTRFVQQTAVLVAAWADAACRICHDELLGEALADKIEGKQLRLFLNVSPTAKPAVEWSKQAGGFVISIPSVVLANDNCREYFEGAIREILQDKPTKVVPPTRLQDSAPAKESDDWETVHVGTFPRASFPKPERLPLVGALPRPDDLLLRPPYNLRVQSSRHMVIVEASHSPTLQLLHDYLSQWCRVNHNRTDEPPLIEITLHQSPFALGQTYDRLELEGGKQLSFVLPTASIVLHIVEGVLGYERVDSTAASWLFCRTEPFRS